MKKIEGWVHPTALTCTQWLTFWRKSVVDIPRYIPATLIIHDQNERNAPDLPMPPVKPIKSGCEMSKREFLQQFVLSHLCANAGLHGSIEAWAESSWDDIEERCKEASCKD
jgi:hypothetical protein